MLRLYYNKADDPAGCWSVDEGTVVTERNFDSVITYEPMRTNQNLNAVWPEPKAWLECDGVLHEEGRTARISHD